MSHILKNLYDNLAEPVLIYDFKKNTFYSNKSFKKSFGKIEDENALKRLEYKFSFDVCLLESDNIKTYTPILSALSSKYDYSCCAIFQKNENENAIYIIKSLNVKSWRVIYFYEITKILQFESLKEENQRLKIQNQEFLSTNAKAQNQAVKMALLNRIASLHESIDIKTLVDSALRELSAIFGASKLYFARLCGNKFIIEQTHPQKYQNEKGELALDDSTCAKLQKGENLIDVVMQNNKNSQSRILLPLVQKNDFLGVIAIFTPQKNITEAQAELLKSISMQISSAFLQASLFEKIRAQKEKLEKTLDELKETQLQLINSEKMASLGQLIASVAHEINTPLASICANNEIMTKFFTSADNQMLNEINAIDKEAIKRITNIVQSLKRFVRLDEETHQEADINKELDLTLTLLHQKTKNSINIVKKYGDIPLISCFPNMLNQVFLNILMNSIQSIEKKGAGGEITIETGMVDDFLYVKISDDGCGISNSDKKKIFQAGFTTKRVGEGTGLGLAICKKIIDEHRGKISFESRQNLGTTFEILIPYA